MKNAKELLEEVLKDFNGILAGFGKYTAVHKFHEGREGSKYVFSHIIDIKEIGREDMGSGILKSHTEIVTESEDIIDLSRNESYESVFTKLFPMLMYTYAEYMKENQHLLKTFKK